MIEYLVEWKITFLHFQLYLILVVNNTIRSKNWNKIIKIKLPMDFLCDLTWQVLNKVEPSPMRPLVENKHGRLVVVPRAYCTLLQNTLSWNEMARRSKTSLENEIERSRWEEKWECIPKLVDQLSSRTTSEPSIGECFCCRLVNSFINISWILL